MVERLRKCQPNGALYQRRPKVENELQELEKLKLAEVVARAKSPAQGLEDAVSSQALVHILRREVRGSRAGDTNAGAIDALTSILMQRCAKILNRKLFRFDEIDRQAMAAEVTDRVIDAIIEGTDRDDYAEVNFNDWLEHRWLDAYRKHQRKAQRMERLGDATEDLADDEAHLVEGDGKLEAADHRTPEALSESREADEKAGLPPIIERANLSPEDKYRVSEMVKRANLPEDVLHAFLSYHYLGLLIESNDPGQHTLVKHFDKSEKTIRLWIKLAEKVFKQLREPKDENEKNDANRPGHSPARISR